MSVCVYPLRPDQQVRLGARTALAALAPFNAPKFWTAPWQLNRSPLTFSALTRQQWRPDMELPEDVQALAGELGPAPSSASARATSRAAQGCQETLTWAFNMNTPSGGFPTLDAVSTPPIPWPFQIVGFSIHAAPLGGAATTLMLQLFLTDIEYTTIQFDSPETRLIQTLDNTGAPLNQIGLQIPLNDLSAQQQQLALATQIIGSNVYDAGKRITIACLLANGGGTGMNGQLTVARCDAVAQFSTTTIRQTTRTTVAAAPVARAPIAAAAPAPVAAPVPDQYVSTGTCLKNVTSGGFPLAYWRQRGYTIPVCTLAPAPRDAGPADDAAAATYWAQILAARGDATRAALFRDMANRMIRGFALTPEQQSYLSSPTAYTPVPVAVFIQSPTGTGYVRL